MLNKFQNFEFNLAMENRLVWQNAGPEGAKKAPEAEGEAKTAKPAETEMQRTQDKCVALVKHLENSGNPKIKEIKEKIIKVNDRLAELAGQKEQMREKTVMSVLDKINMQIDSAVGKERINIAKNILDTSKADFDKGNFANLTDVFMLLKNDGVALKGTGISAERKNDTMVVKSGDKTYEIKMKLENGKWEMYEVERDGKSVSLKYMQAPGRELKKTAMTGINVSSYENNPNTSTKIKYLAAKPAEAEPEPVGKPVEAKDQAESVSNQQLLDNFSLLHNKNIKIKDSPVLMNYLNSIKQATKEPLRVLGEVEKEGKKFPTVALVSAAQENGKMYYRLSIMEGDPKIPGKWRSITVDYWPKQDEKVKFAGKDAVYEQHEKGISMNRENEQLRSENLKGFKLMQNEDDITKLNKSASEIALAYGITPPFKSEIGRDKTGNSFIVEMNQVGEKTTLTIQVRKYGETAFYKAYEDTGDGKPTLFEGPKAKPVEDAGRENPEVKAYREELSKNLDSILKDLNKTEGLRKMQQDLIGNKAEGKSDAEKLKIYQEASDAAVRFRSILNGTREQAGKVGASIDELRKGIDNALAVLPQESRIQYADLIKTGKATEAMAAKPKETPEQAEASARVEWAKNLGAKVDQLGKIVGRETFLKEIFQNKKQADYKALTDNIKNLKFLIDDSVKSKDVSYTECKNFWTETLKALTTAKKLTTMHKGDINDLTNVEMVARPKFNVTEADKEEFAREDEIRRMTGAA